MQDTRKKSTAVALCIQVLIFSVQSVIYFLYSLPWRIGSGVSLSASMFFAALGIIAVWLLRDYYSDAKLVKRSTLRFWGGVCLLLSAFKRLKPYFSGQVSEDYR